MHITQGSLDRLYTASHVSTADEKFFEEEVKEFKRCLQIVDNALSKAPVD